MVRKKRTWLLLRSWHCSSPSVRRLWWRTTTSSSDTSGSSSGSDIKVGLVTDTGGVDDKGFNQFSIAGLNEAKDKLGVQTRVYVSKTADDYQPNLTAASDDGNDLVISVGFLLSPSTIAVAKQYPDIKYAGVDHFYGKRQRRRMRRSETCALPNTLGMQYPSRVGVSRRVVAALMTKTGTVSTVGGKKIPPVDNWIAGFQYGVKQTKPEHQDRERVLAGLRGSRQVQGDRARPDRARLGRRLPGRRQVRPRSDRRRLREGQDGDRRRRRPVRPGRLRDRRAR